MRLHGRYRNLYGDFRTTRNNFEGSFQTVTRSWPPIKNQKMRTPLINNRIFGLHNQRGSSATKSKQSSMY